MRIVTAQRTLNGIHDVRRPDSRSPSGRWADELIGHWKAASDSWRRRLRAGRAAVTAWTRVRHDERGGTQVPELIGGASGLGWVAVKAVLLFAVAVIGLRLGERRTLAQLSAFDFAVAVAVGSIIGRGATASDTSFASSAVALVTFLLAHRVVAVLRRHSRVVRLIDHPPRVLVAGGELQGRELARAGLTAADVHALLREKGVGDLSQVGYLLYEEGGVVTVVGAGREPGPLVRDGLTASGYRRVPPKPGRLGSQGE